MPESSHPSRRTFLAAAAAAGAALLLPGPLQGLTASRSLDLLHTHTGERLSGIEYFAGGRYLPDALREVNHHLRDWRTGEAHEIDPALLDYLHALQQATGSRRPFEIISAYRSPATNAVLRAASSRVSATSLHMRGRAIDLRLGDVPLTRLRAAAHGLRRGGVGYYPASNFVHVDTGRVRTW
jgi:uncharacterized protein YcbK (DUF882 family)